MKQFSDALKTPALPTQITIRTGPMFGFDQADIKKQGRATLDQLAQKLQAMDLSVVITIGHTDFVGSDVYNQKISKQRAAALRGYFVGKGVDAARIKSEGRGEKEPIASNATAQGRALNRRIEIEVTGYEVGHVKQ